MTGRLEVEVTPPWPYRLPRRGAGDGTTRARDGVLSRLLHIDSRPIVVHAWQRDSGDVVFRAAGDARKRELTVAIERMRFALGVDEDYAALYAEYRHDPLIGPAIRRRPWVRPRRRPWPWDALVSAIAGQLIEASRARQIERRMVRRWGRGIEARPRSVWTGPGPLRDFPSALVVAGRAPAELAAMDLAPARALAMIRCAKEVANGWTDLIDPAADARLLAISEIGPWTVQCLGMYGRGEPDSLPAGDLAFVKLVGRLAGLRRRASVAEVEEYFAPYAPYRGLAAMFALTQYHLGIEAGPPLRLAA